MKAVILSLIVAMMWGITPIFEKLSLIKASPLTVLTIRSLFASTCLIVIALITKDYRQYPTLDGKTLIWILAGSLLGGIVGLFIYFTALKADIASRVVPIVASYPLFAAFYAFLFLNEALSIPKILGIILIVVGIALVK